MAYGRINHRRLTAGLQLMAAAVLEELLPQGSTGKAAVATAWFRFPMAIRRELKQVMRCGYTKREAIAFALSYELGGGACKTCAAVDKNGSYRMLRILEWDLSDTVRDSVEWQQVSPGVVGRVYPGYPGVLTGYRTTGEAVAMNLSPDWGNNINYKGLPVSWLIRKSLVSDGRLVHNLLKCGPVVQPAWAIVKEKEKAYKVKFQTSGKHFIMEAVAGGDPLLIQNDWECDPSLRSDMAAWVTNNNNELVHAVPLEKLPDRANKSLIAVDAVVM
jgi:hypothetical protein